MTWRAFRLRLAGLSADSRWMGALLADRQNSRDTVVLEDEAAAEAFVLTLGG